MLGIGVEGGFDGEESDGVEEMAQHNVVIYPSMQSVSSFKSIFVKILFFFVFRFFLLHIPIKKVVFVSVSI